MGRSTGPDSASAGTIPKRVTRSVVALRKTVIRLASVVSGSLWAGAAAADNACGTVDMVLCALPAAVLAAWPTAAAWLGVPPRSVFGCGEVNGVSTVAAADEPA